ncbi:hypothetical protein TH606_01905 [Thermodesulfatator autotrophicus]|uniref:Transposase n=2 Tax=Thermodesulfatator autotrophicus TaxID=1795632 RepID=A0A177E9G8_9BACT|nr:hypothetical protein TH606_01905 [Thermodesulfatator autotrophicus]
MGALSAVRSKEGRLREYYDKLVKRGKLKKVALIACARKLLIYTFYNYRKWQEKWQMEAQSA